MAIADDIATMRKTGASDDEVLNAIRQGAPVYGSDIDTMAKAGGTPTQMVDAILAAPDQTQAPKTSGLTRFMQGIGYGASNELSDHAATIRDTQGAGPASDAMSTVAGAIKPGADYQPANIDWSRPSTLITEAPQAAAESAAGMGGLWAAMGAGGLAGSIIGPEGSLPGALIGGLGYGIHKYLGRGAEARAANNGEVDDQGNPLPPTSSDLLQAAPGAVGSAALDTAGMKLGHLIGPGTVVKGAGLDAAKGMAANVAKDAAAYGGLGAASNVVQQTGDTAFTNKGFNLDLNQVANAGVGGATLAGATRGLMSTGELMGASRHAGGDIEQQNKLADLMKSDRVSGDPTDPKQREQVLKNTKAVLDSDLTDAQSNLKAHVAGAEDAGLPSGHYDDAQQAAKDATTNLKQGATLDPAQVDNLKSALSGDPATQPLLDALLQRNEFNRIGAQMQFGGISDTVQSASPYWMRNGIPGMVLHTLSRPTVRGATHMAALGGMTAALSHLPMLISGAALPLGVLALAKVGDRLMGNGNRLGDYVNRFGGTQAPGAPTQPQPEAQAARGVPPAAPAPYTIPPAVTAALQARMAAAGQGPTSPVPTQAPAPSPPHVIPQEVVDANRARMATAAIKQPVLPNIAPQMPNPAAGLQSGDTVSVADARARATQQQSNRDQQTMSLAPVKGSKIEIQTHWEGVLKQAQAVLNDPSATPEAKQQAKLAKTTAIRNIASPDLQRVPMAMPQQSAPVAALEPVVANNGFSRPPQPPQAGPAPAPAPPPQVNGTPAGADITPGSALQRIQQIQAQRPLSNGHAPEAPSGTVAPGVTPMPEGYHVDLPNGSVFQAHGDTRVSQEARTAGTIQRNAAEMAKLDGMRGLDLSPAGEMAVEKLLPLWKNAATNNVKSVTDARSFVEHSVKPHFGAEDAAKVDAHMEAQGPDGGNFYSQFGKDPGKITKSRQSSGKAVGLARAHAKASRHTNGHGGHHHTKK